LTDDQVATIATTVPPQFTSDPILTANGSLDQPYDDSIASDAFAPDGGVLSFSKIAGPDWLTVARDGRLSGTPRLADVGTNTFAVRVINAGGAAAVMRLTIAVDARPPVRRVTGARDRIRPGDTP
jgi:hypothetical protein